MTLYSNKKKNKYLAIDSAGVWFQHKNDIVCWLWPWRRGPEGKKYMVWLGGFATFPSLQAIDEFWVSYEKERERRELALC